MILEYLSKGKENAVSTPMLCDMTGLDVRGLRAAVARERLAGEIILSSSRGGYYIPADRGEVEEFVKTLDGKGRSIMCALKSARRYLKSTAPKDSMQTSLEL